jgi:hypothetical protein
MVRSVLRVRVAVCVLLAVGVVGCGDPPPELAEPTGPATRPPAVDGVVDLPGDAQPGDDSPGGMTSGVLAADTEGCVWLFDEGEEGEPLEPEVALLWPAGYSFDTTTQQILDPAGEVVASIGDRVALGGGETPHRTPEWCDVAERVWSVSSIEGRG